MVKELLRARTYQYGTRSFSAVGACAKRILVTGVIPREGGESSRPRRLDSLIAVSGYWIARSSRAMTAGGVANLPHKRVIARSTCDEAIQNPSTEAAWIASLRSQ